MMAFCSGKIFSSLSHASGADIACRLIVNRPGITKSHALRIAIAQIAFENTAPAGIPSHGTKGAGRNTHFAADAEVLVYSDALKRRITVNGIFGANFQTGSIFTLLAAHGYINPDVFPFDNLNAGQSRVADTIMTDRTNEFTVSATRALFRIYRQ
jgi:hypothetical protein